MSCGGGSGETPEWKTILKNIKKDVETLKKNDKKLDKVVEAQAVGLEKEREKIVERIQKNLDEYKHLSEIEIQNQRETELQHRLRNKSQLLDEKDREIYQLRRSNEEANNKIKSEISRNENIMMGYKEKEEECKKIQEKYTEKEEECNNLLKMVQNGESKIDEVQIQNRSLDEEIKSLQNQLKEHEQQIKDYKGKLYVKERTLEENWKTTESLQQNATVYKNNEKSLKQELDGKTERVRSLEVENNGYKNQITSLIQDLEDTREQVKSLEVENNGYRNQITRFEKSVQEYKKEKTTLERQLEEANMQNNSLMEMVKTCERRIDEVQMENKSLYEENQGLFQQLSDLNNKNCELWTELESRKKNYVQSVNKLQDTINSLHQNVIAERKAKEDALNRLSAAAASRLRDNNPSITDLSDPNRPLKLAEKISELYDNEWTNAMENLEDINIEEEEGVVILLGIFTKIFERCQDIAAEHLKKLPQILVLPEHISMSKTEFKLPLLASEILKPLKDFRKSHANQAVAVIQEVIRKELRNNENPLIKDLSETRLDACEEYIQKCAELCWMMRVQDPPVHMKWKFEENDTFNTDLLRSYTKSGKFVDFVVWPVLYLHEDGPLLAKGVAQGKKVNSQKTKKVNEDATASTGAEDPPLSTSDPRAEKNETGDEPSDYDSTVPQDNVTNGEGSRINEDLSVKRKESSSSSDDSASDDDKKDVKSEQLKPTGYLVGEGDRSNSKPSQDPVDTRETSC